MPSHGSINKLTALQTFKLMNLVRDQYVQKRISDREFAVFATEELKFGFPISHTSVEIGRRALEIPATKLAIRAENAMRMAAAKREREKARAEKLHAAKVAAEHAHPNGTALARIAELEDQVARIREFIRTELDKEI